MQPEYRNIYYNARRAAGLTQERWAEVIGCSVESVRNYEAGAQTPADEIVCRMAETSGVAALGYWHLRRKSTIAAEELPEVDHLSLPQAVVQLLVAVDDFAEQHGDLMRVAADGKISPDEVTSWAQIRHRLDGVVRAALQVRYAEGGD